VASSPQDEQVVRNAYAKLAYAAQSHTVFVEATKKPNLKSSELAHKLQDNELRFDITKMSRGALSDIASRPFSEFVTRLDTQPILQIVHNTQTVDENGKRFTTNFADPHWSHGSQLQDYPDPLVKTVLERGNFSRYVAATITVRFQGQSRTYRALWFFGSDIWSADLVVGAGGVVKDFLTESMFPSVLTDTSFRSRSVVNDWLNSTQRFESACKTGKQDVCCDSTTMRCGVHSEDLRSTKPAPNTTAAPKKEGFW
jgi:hypothetical protein